VQHTTTHTQTQPNPAETRECSPAAFVGALQGHSNSQRQQDEGNLRICSEHGVRPVRAQRHRRHSRPLPHAHAVAGDIPQSPDPYQGWS